MIDCLICANSTYCYQCKSNYLSSDNFGCFINCNNDPGFISLINFEKICLKINLNNNKN